jgi:hypothetical protein
LIDAAGWMLLKTMLTVEIRLAVKVEISLLEVTGSKAGQVVRPFD